MGQAQVFENLGRAWASLCSVDTAIVNGSTRSGFTSGRQLIRENQREVAKLLISLRLTRNFMSKVTVVGSLWIFVRKCIYDSASASAVFLISSLKLQARLLIKLFFLKENKGDELLDLLHTKLNLLHTTKNSFK